MNSTLSRTRDEALSDALAGLLEHAREFPQDRPSGTPEEVAFGDADRFVGRLAEHLQYTEATLFPALREVEPGSACDIEDLKKDHRLLHLYARDLGLQIRGGDRRGVHEVARSFLALLLDHIHRETKGVDRMVGSLDVLNAQRLSKALKEGSPDCATADSKGPLRCPVVSV